MVMLLLIVLVLAALLGVCGFFYLQLKRRRKRGQMEKPELKKDDSSWGNCAKCQQWRIIVKKELGLCAACWSSIGTKSLS